MDETLQHMRDR